MQICRCLVVLEIHLKQMNENIDCKKQFEVWVMNQNHESRVDSKAQFARLVLKCRDFQWRGI